MRISLHMDTDLLTWIDGRGERSHVIREGLYRYRELLAVGRHLLRARGLTAGDLRAIAACTTSTAWSAASLGPVRPDGNSIAADVADEEPGVAAQFTDRDRLLAILRDLSAAEVAGLIDALERYWRAVGTGMQVDPAAMLGEAR